MRCGQCHSYVPEGVTQTCPACQAPLASKLEASAQGTPAAGAHRAFATEATYSLKVIFGPLNSATDPSLGSISFGREGFSIVWDSGRRWERIFYKDVARLRLIDLNIVMDIKGVESRLAVGPATLPGWLFFLTPLRKGATIQIFEKLQSMRNLP